MAVLSLPYGNLFHLLGILKITSENNKLSKHQLYLSNINILKAACLACVSSSKFYLCFAVYIRECYMNRNMKKLLTLKKIPY